MAIYSVTVDVSATAAYPALASPQVTIPFIPRSIVVINEDAADDAYVSLDGTTDAAHLQPQTPSAGIELSQQVLKMWLKRGAVGVAPTNIQIIAES